MCINYQIDFKLILNGQKEMSCLKDTCTAFIAEWLLADLVAWQLYFSAGPRVGQYTQHYRMEKLEEMTKSLKAWSTLICVLHTAPMLGFPL